MVKSASGSEKIISDSAVENITRAEELAYELHIEEVMTRDVISITPEMTMSVVLEIFRKIRISGAPVLDPDRNLLGIISMQDLINALLHSDLEAPVNRYMSSTLITVKGSDPVVEALQLFVTTKVGRLPVVDGQGKMIGLLTKGDITRGLLLALQKDYQVEELRRYRASHLFEDIISDRTSLILRYTIKAHDFTQGGAASSHIKRALKRLGANPLIARRVGIAVYEAEMNLIIHTTNGGTLRVEIEPHQISIDAYDFGPGIKDIEEALKSGFSTATEEIRELGFGAGMGLANIARCVDVLKLESVVGKGTRLRLKILLDEPDGVGEGYITNKDHAPK